MDDYVKKERELIHLPPITQRDLRMCAQDIINARYTLAKKRGTEQLEIALNPRNPVDIEIYNILTTLMDYEMVATSSDGTMPILIKCQLRDHFLPFAAIFIKKKEKKVVTPMQSDCMLM
jgi:hypothetical protein